MMNQTSSKFYVIETRYVGPEEKYDADTIGVYKTPAFGNMDKRPVIDGWAGETSGWSIYALGEYDSIDCAEARIATEYPERREAEIDDDDCVSLYRPGRYATMTREMSREWLYEAIETLTGDETDADLQAVLAIAEANANDGGCTLHQSALSSLTDARDEKAAAQADEE